MTSRRTRDALTVLAPTSMTGPGGPGLRPSRRSFMAGVGVVGLGLLTGCGRTNTVATGPAPDGEIESRLNIYNWGAYDDPDLISAWADSNDVQVQVDAYGSNEELIVKLAATRGTSGYDIVVPTSTRVPDMISHNLIQRLDHSLLPNMSTISPEFLDRDYDRGNEYSICKAWGTTGFVYDATVIDEDLTSWQDFIRVAQGPAKGTTMLLEDSWEVVAIALSALGFDLNTTDESELDQAADIIVNDIAPSVRAYLGNVTTAMAQGGFTLIHCFNGDARMGILEADEPDRWKFVFPTPNANIWIDNWCIASGAPHPDAAHSFIDYIIAPDQALAEVDYIGYSTGSKVLDEPGIEAEFERSDLIFPDQAVLDRLVSSVFNAGAQRRVDILNDAKARSGT